MSAILPIVHRALPLPGLKVELAGAARRGCDASDGIQVLLTQADITQVAAENSSLPVVGPQATVVLEAVAKALQVSAQ